MSRTRKMLSVAVALVAVMALGSVAQAATYYEADFSTDPGWTEDSTGSSDYSYSATLDRSFFYSPDKVSYVTAATPTITGQGTEYSVTVQFSPLSVADPDNQTYILAPLSGSSERDLCFALNFGGGSGALFSVRSNLAAGGGSTWGWSDYDRLTIGETYEARYDRYGDYMNVYIRKVGDAWTQLNSANGTDKFYLIGNHADTLTFDHIEAGIDKIYTRTHFSISNLVVENVPEPASIGLLTMGAIWALLRKKRRVVG